MAAACTLPQGQFPQLPPPSEPPAADPVEEMPELPAEPQLQPFPEVLVLLDLATEVIESSTPEARREIENTQRRRFESAPSFDNLLRLTIVRAFSAALPAELQEVRADLQVLANGRHELTDDQRRVALMVLIMVDKRLQLGEQILTLQKKIDSLTEIEASLNHTGDKETPEGTP